MNERGARAHARDRRAALLDAARARSCGTRARRRATRSAVQALRWTATATPCWRWSSRPGRRATPASAPASTAATWSPPRRTRRCRRSSARSTAARQRAARGLVHGDAARRPAADRREGAGGGRGGRPRRARGVRRARRRGGRRRALPPDGAAARRAASTWPTPQRGAQWPSPLTPARCGIEPSLDEVRALATRAQPRRRFATRFIADCETPVSRLPQAARAPAAPAFLLESAEQGQRVGRWSFIGFRPRTRPALVARRRRRPVRAGRRRGRAATARRRSTDLPPFAGGRGRLFGYDLVRTRRAARRAQPGRRSGCPTWR